MKFLLFYSQYSFLASQVGSLAITNVRSHQAWPSYQEALFTTLPGENEIFITTSAPAHVNDSSILYDIKEIHEDFQIVSSSTVGRSTSFLAKHLPLASLTSPHSHALEFRITAYTEENGEKVLESAPVYFKQSVKDQIRQEYVDKRDFQSAFIR